jgi:hypothetical protein
MCAAGISHRVITGQVVNTKRITLSAARGPQVCRGVGPAGGDQARAVFSDRTSGELQ